MVLADHEREELLNDYIDGRLAESERQQVEILLAKDEALRAELERYQLISRAIRTAPILDDLTKICSVLKSFGNLSCSLIVYLSQVKLLFKFSNTVLGFITLFSKPAAIVKVLNTDPSS